MCHVAISSAVCAMCVLITVPKSIIFNKITTSDARTVVHNVAILIIGTRHFTVPVVPVVVSSSLSEIPFGHLQFAFAFDAFVLCPIHNHNRSFYFPSRTQFSIPPIYLPTASKLLCTFQSIGETVWNAFCEPKQVAQIKLVGWTLNTGTFDLIGANRTNSVSKWNVSIFLFHRWRLTIWTASF